MAKRIGLLLFVLATLPAGGCSDETVRRDTYVREERSGGFADDGIRQEEHRTERWERRD
jgi:hypothetical protein